MHDQLHEDIPDAEAAKQAFAELVAHLIEHLVVPT
jgi:hypothetical protein